jgi:hypothetical protein
MPPGAGQEYHLPQIIHKIGKATEDRVLERIFLPIVMQYVEIKRQKPRREGRPRMSENTLSSVQSEKSMNNPGYDIPLFLYIGIHDIDN